MRRIGGDAHFAEAMSLIDMATRQVSVAGEAAEAAVAPGQAWLSQHGSREGSSNAGLQSKQISSGTGTSHAPSELLPPVGPDSGDSSLHPGPGTKTARGAELEQLHPGGCPHESGAYNYTGGMVTKYADGFFVDVEKGVTPAQVQHFHDALDSLPPRLGGAVKSLSLRTANSPDNAYGSAFQRHVVLWEVGTHPNDSLVSALAHEAWHAAGDARSTELGVDPDGGPPDAHAWSRAALRDAVRIRRVRNRPRGDVAWDQGLLNVPTPGKVFATDASADGYVVKVFQSPAVSDYGATAMYEDWADAGEFWSWSERNNGLGKRPDGTRVLFEDLFPYRAELLRECIGLGVQW